MKIVLLYSRNVFLKGNLKYLLLYNVIIKKNSKFFSKEIIQKDDKINKIRLDQQNITDVPVIRKYITNMFFVIKNFSRFRNKKFK